MTRIEARKQDKSFYVEFNNESGAYCVFGDNSGFAYAAYVSSVEAEAKSKEMNK
jgi:hypothetical protein